jgi:hypothetical protein
VVAVVVVSRSQEGSRRGMPLAVNDYQDRVPVGEDRVCFKGMQQCSSLIRMAMGRGHICCRASTRLPCHQQAYLAVNLQVL